MATDASNETAIFERIVLPNEPYENQSAARSILALGFSAVDRARMQELAEKARA